MKKISFGDRIRYAFDRTISRGPVALIGWLAVLSLVVIIVASIVIVLVDIRPAGSTESLGFFEAAWESLMRTFDAGTMGGDAGWGYRIVMLGVTIGGIFVISTLIGVLTAGVEGKIDDLRKGRSRVIETGHTVILGWSTQIFSVISELVVANANQRRSCIVVLGEKDKVELEDAIRERVGSTGRTRIVCRTGSPIEMTDLEIVGLHTSKSIIILSPEEEDPDSQVIKTMLAITNHPRRRPEPYHIVAEIRDPKNMEVARMVGKGEVELVLTGELVSRIIAQTCRQSGLSVVYTELLDFGGDEIYFQEEPRLVGKSLGEALLMYEDSAVIGLSSQGVPRLNPPLDTRIQEGDRIIAISEDDDTVRLSGLTELGLREDAIRAGRPVQAAPERTLILGWNWRAPAVINELDNYVPAGSEVKVVASCPEAAEAIGRYCADVVNQTVSFQEGDTTDRRTLDELAIERYNHVILLCYCDTLDAQQADARTLITLLHLRDIAERVGHPFSIVSEMLDIRNRNLAEVTRADDFIVSDKLISLMLAQISENKALNAVFEDIFDPEGSEIYLKPAADYVELGRPLSFYNVVESARRRGEIALGYRLQALAGDAGQAHGVVVNPDKSKPVTFGERDRIIVVAED
jgi:voltage-gated potassium channel Kch